MPPVTPTLTTAASSPAAASPGAGQSGPDAKPADSSHATQDAKPSAESSPEQGAKPTLAQMIAEEAGPSEESAESPTEPKEPESGQPEAEGAEATDDQSSTTEGSEADVPFHKHPRWQEMVAQNKQLQEQLATATQFQRRTEEAGISPEETQAGVEIMVAMRHDPLRALEMLRPYVEQLKQLAGEVLPEDLSKQVEEGELSEGAAKQVARARTEAAVARQQAEHLKARSQQGQAAQVGQAMVSAVSAWETNVKQSDPDYAKKQAMVCRFAQARANENPPKTPEEAVQLAQAAYAEVNQALGAMLPPAQTVKARLNSRNSSATARPKAIGIRAIIDEEAG